MQTDLPMITTREINGSARHERDELKCHQLPRSSDISTDPHIYRTITTRSMTRAATKPSLCFNSTQHTFFDDYLFEVASMRMHQASHRLVSFDHVHSASTRSDRVPR